MTWPLRYRILKLVHYFRGQMLDLEKFLGCLEKNPGRIEGHLLEARRARRLREA